MLEELRTKAYQWFLDNRNPDTGMVTNGYQGSGSVSWTGFYLTILPTLVQEKIVSPDAAEQQTRETFSFSLSELEHYQGFFYKSIDPRTGKRDLLSSTSLIDTTVFLNGCIVAAQRFPALLPLLSELLERVQWNSYIVQDEGRPFLASSWSPETGYGPAATTCSCENLMAYLLASGTGSIPGTHWYNTRIVTHGVKGVIVMNLGHPLETALIGLNWLDLKSVWDYRYTDFFKNARNTVLVSEADLPHIGNVLVEDINQRTGLVHKLYMSHPVAVRGMKEIGFRRKDAPFFRGGETRYPSGD